MATELESGRYLLSEEEVDANGSAAELLHRRMSMSVALTSPLTRDEWLMVLAARQCVEGRPEALDILIAKLEDQLEQRGRRH